MDSAANYRETIDLSGQVTLLDSITGNTTHAFGANLDVLYNTETINISGHADISALLTMISNAIEEPLPVELKPYFKDLAFAAILCGEKNWISAPLLDYALSKESGERISGAWVSDFMDIASASDLNELMSATEKVESSAIGEMLVQIGVMSAKGQELFMYDNINEMTALFVTMFDDSTFTRSGSSYKWHFGEREFANLVGEIDPEKTLDMSDLGIDKFAIDMTFNADGSGDYAFVLSADGVKMTASGTADASRSSLDITVQIRNVCDATLSSKNRLNTTNEKPLKNPPAGTLIIDGDSL